MTITKSWVWLEQLLMNWLCYASDLLVFVWVVLDLFVQLVSIHTLEWMTSTVSMDRKVLSFNRGFYWENLNYYREFGFFEVTSTSGTSNKAPRTSEKLKASYKDSSFVVIQQIYHNYPSKDAINSFPKLLNPHNCSNFPSKTDFKPKLHSK